MEKWKDGMTESYEFTIYPFIQLSRLTNKHKLKNGKAEKCKVGMSESYEFTIYPNIQLSRLTNKHKLKKMEKWKYGLLETQLT